MAGVWTQCGVFTDHVGGYEAEWAETVTLSRPCPPSIRRAYGPKRHSWSGSLIPLSDEQVLGMWTRGLPLPEEAVGGRA